MKIYIPHSNSFNFKKELYEPVRKSILNQKYSITFPHENSKNIFNSKEFMKTCDLVIAEVSYPSTGLGIELGWANYYKIPVICIFKNGTKPSSSLKTVSNNFIEYSNIQEMALKVDLTISNIKL